MRKFKKNNSAFITFFRSHKYIAVCILLIASVALLSFGIRYGRYTYNVVRLYYLRTQNFYFGSNKLVYEPDPTKPIKTYGISPWDAAGPLPITITVNSVENSLKGTTSEVNYRVVVTCDNTSKVDCSLKRGETTYDSLSPDVDFVIPYYSGELENNNDTFVIIVTPKTDQQGNTLLIEDEEVNVYVEATSTSPYSQTLKGKFKITVGMPGIKYEINDVGGRSYLDALITNTNGSASFVGLKIDIDDFTFDMSNTVYNNCVLISSLNGENCAYKVTSDSGYEYISEIYFKVNPRASALVRFYKDGANVNSDFSYSSSNPTGNTEVKYCVLDVDTLTQSAINGCTWY